MRARLRRTLLNLVLLASAAVAVVGCDLGAAVPRTADAQDAHTGDAPDTQTTPDTGVVDTGEVADLDERDLEGVPPQYDAADLARGARLYDSWFKETAHPSPFTPMPLYPPSGPMARYPGDTWRCATCHGWDYRGVDGASAAGPTFTGVNGLVTLTDERPRALYFALAGDLAEHDFLTLTDLTGRDLWDLVKFVKEGLRDTSTVIDAQGRFAGDASAGKVAYDALCVTCHGEQGAAFSFTRFGEVLGTSALEAPFRVAHRLQFGVPGVEKPRGVEAGWTPQVLGDLGAHLQTLPTSYADVADAARGGRLYDRWWGVDALAPPTGRNPLYPATGGQAAAGAATWACAECHGYDYLGVEGRYASGVHYSGSPGIRQVRSEDPRRLYAALTGEVAEHNLLAWGLPNQDLWDLVHFVRGGTIDTSRYIDPEQGRYLANAPAGGTTYQAQCEACHALDGRAIDLGDGQGLADLPLDDLWRTLHVLRVGRTGCDGPAFFGLDEAPAPAEEAANVGAYIATLPSL